MAAAAAATSSLMLQRASFGPIKGPGAILLYLIVETLFPNDVFFQTDLRNF